MKGIIHHDIKPANILITSDFSVVKLIDWGVSDYYRPDLLYINSAQSGTKLYKAPEQLLKLRKHISTAIDI